MILEPIAENAVTFYFDSCTMLLGPIPNYTNVFFIDIWIIILYFA